MSEPLADALEALNPVIDRLDGNLLRYKDLLDEAGYTKAKEHPEVRRLLQKLGTEVGRQMIGEDTWVNIAGRNIDEDMQIYRRDVTITGIRFKNELAMVRKRGGILLYVDRPGLPAAPSSAHASENSLTKEDFDVVVENDGTLEELFVKVDLELPSWSSVRATRARRRDLELDIWPVYDH